MKTVVTALGGSLLRPEIEERDRWLFQLCVMVKKLVDGEIRIGLVVGGGSPARESISLVKTLINDVDALDRIGISATRLNATIIKEAMKEIGIEVPDEVPTNVEQAMIMMKKYPVVIMGGTFPGHTTDNVAIELAVASEASKCIVATNVSKVYDEDPKINKNAKSFDKLSHKELQQIVGPPEHLRAGKSQIVDPVGVQCALINNLILNILDGRDIENMKNAIENKSFRGTIVSE